MGVGIRHTRNDDGGLDFRLRGNDVFRRFQSFREFMEMILQIEIAPGFVGRRYGQWAFYPLECTEGREIPLRGLLAPVAGI